MARLKWKPTLFSFLLILRFGLTTTAPSPTLSLGFAHACAVLSTGGAKCWGRDSFGQLGNGGSNTNQDTPVTVSGLNGAVAISAGAEYTCALLSSGEATCWGKDEDGQLGDGGSNTAQGTPVHVSGLNGVVAIAAGGEHTCALLGTTGVKCWGKNSHGQLGDGGSNTDQGTPVTVSGLTGVVAITAGDYHTCALLATGGAKCWGHGSDGQLGDGGSTSAQNTPVAVSGLTGAVAIAAGFCHTCAVLATGGAKCWGLDDHGQLGDGGSNTNQNTPVAVSGLAEAVAIAAGTYHTCAVLATGVAKCWGGDEDGQLGNGGSNTGHNSPVAVAGLTSIRGEPSPTRHPTQPTRQPTTSPTAPTPTPTMSPSTLACGLADWFGDVFKGFGCIRGHLDVSQPGKTITNLSFVGASATKGGGIYFAENGTVQSCFFLSNAASTSGGGIYFQKSGTVESSSFVNNTAPSRGAALHIVEEASVAECIFQGNTVPGLLRFHLFVGGAYSFTSVHVTESTETRDYGPSMLQLGMANSNACPSNYKHITTEAQCTTAAGSSGLDLDSKISTENTGTFPKGCYLYNSKTVWFNSHPTGQASSSGKLICIVDYDNFTGCSHKFNSSTYATKATTCYATVGKSCTARCDENASSYRSFGSLTCSGATFSGTSFCTAPTSSPTSFPTSSPTISPSTSPSSAPTSSSPTISPTSSPTSSPTALPTVSPTLSCRPGTFGTHGGNCTRCAFGQYQDGSGGSICKTCAIGRWFNGTRRACAACPTDTYQDDSARGVHAQRSMLTGALAMAAAPLGQWPPLPVPLEQLASDQTQAPNASHVVLTTDVLDLLLSPYRACIRCPCGYFQLNTGKDRCQASLGCPEGEGYYGNASGCTDCIAGRFSEGFSTDMCKMCLAGQSAPGIGNKVCVKCLAGQHQPESGKPTCQDCAAGTYTERTGRAQCTNCTTGTYVDGTGTAICLECAEGRWQRLVGQHDCDACPAAFYGARLAAMECTDCVRGEYSEVPGATVCKKCGAGKFLNDGQNVCKDCPASYFETRAAVVECTRCTGGEYSILPGATECKDCAVGKFLLAYGENVCKDCPASYYGAREAAVSCSTCAEGQYSSQPGATVCEMCKAGTFLTAGTCELCPTGRMQAVKGSTQCTLCQGNRYQDRPGAIACKQCAPDATPINTSSSCACGLELFEVGMRAAASAPNATADEQECPRVVVGGGGVIMNMAGVAVNEHRAGCCLPCPVGAWCQSGFPLAQQGYWRKAFPPAEIGSDGRMTASLPVITMCRASLACPGEADTPDALIATGDLPSQCREGHTGPMCGACESGWRPDASDLCVACPAPSARAMNPATVKALALVLGSLVLCVAITVAVTSRRVQNMLGSSSKEGKAEDGGAEGVPKQQPGSQWAPSKLPMQQRLGKTSVHQNQASGQSIWAYGNRIGTATPFIQRIVALDSVFTWLPWPPLMTKALKVLKIVIFNIGQFFAFISPCALHVDIEQQLSMALVALPWIVVVFGCAKLLSSAVLSRRREKQKKANKRNAYGQRKLKRKEDGTAQGNEEKENAIASFPSVADNCKKNNTSTKISTRKSRRRGMYTVNVVLLGLGLSLGKLAHPGVSKQLLLFGVCAEIGAGTSVMLAAVDVRCSLGDATYARIVAMSVVGIVFVAVGFPILLASVVYRDRLRSQRERLAHDADDRAGRQRAILSLLHVQTPVERLAAKTHQWQARRRDHFDMLRHKAIRWVVDKFKPRFWWWFIVEMLFSLILISLLQLATGGIWQKYYLGFFFAVLQLMLPALLKPHVAPVDDQLAIVSGTVYFLLLLGRMPRHFVDLQLGIDAQQHAAAVQETEILLDATFIVGMVAILAVLLGIGRHVCSVRALTSMFKQDGQRKSRTRVMPVESSPSDPQAKTDRVNALADKEGDGSKPAAQHKHAHLHRCPQDVLRAVNKHLRQEYEKAWRHVEVLQTEVMATAIQAVMRGHASRATSFVRVLGGVHQAVDADQPTQQSPQKATVVNVNKQESGPKSRRMFSRLPKRTPSIDERRKSRLHLTDDAHAVLILKEDKLEHAQSQKQLARAQESSAELGAHKRLMKEIRHKAKGRGLAQLWKDAHLASPAGGAVGNESGVGTTISFEHAALLLEAIAGRELDRALLRRTLARCDRNGDGVLDADELNWMLGHGQQEERNSSVTVVSAVAVAPKKKREKA